MATSKIIKSITFSDTKLFREFLSKQSNFSQSIRALIYEYVYQRKGNIEDVGKNFDSHLSEFFLNEQSNTAPEQLHSLQQVESTESSISEQKTQEEPTPVMVANHTPVPSKEPAGDGEIPSCYL